MIFTFPYTMVQAFIILYSHSCFLSKNRAVQWKGDTLTPGKVKLQEWTSIAGGVPIFNYQSPNQWGNKNYKNQISRVHPVYFFVLLLPTSFFKLNTTNS